MKNSRILGKEGESFVFAEMRKYGFLPKHMGFHGPFDLFCNRNRVEVKASKWREGGWRFNIHRRGILNESEVDVYVLVCFRKDADPVCVVLPAPLGSKVFMLPTHRIISGVTRRSVDNWNLLNIPRCSESEGGSRTAPPLRKPVSQADITLTWLTDMYPRGFKPNWNCYVPPEVYRYE